MKKILPILLILVLFALGAAAEETHNEMTTYSIVYSSENPIPEIAANVRPSVVQVTTYKVKSNGKSKQVEFGSGTYIGRSADDSLGYILTNSHVIDDGNKYFIKWLNGTDMECAVVGSDTSMDIAILSFDDEAPSDATPIPMGDSDELQIGELAIVIGNPGTSDYVLFGTVTAGIVSGLERNGVSSDTMTRGVSMVQIDAAINAGNSGGAFLNAKGELVGIPTLKVSIDEDDLYEGIGFCVPINSVKNIMDDLIETGKVSRAQLGVSLSDSEGVDKAGDDEAPAGAMVKGVIDGSSADIEGLRKNDIITEIENVRVKSVADVTRELEKYEDGEIVTLSVYRNTDEDGNPLKKYEEHTFNVLLMVF